MGDKVSKAIALVQQGYPSLFKFISANETGDTGGHQCGFYIARDFAELILGRSCVKGDNIDRAVKLVWDDGRVTESRCVYYGNGSRNESRITRFGQGFAYLQSDYVGSLVVFIRENDSTVHSFVFSSEEEIDEFLGVLGLGPTDANKMISLEPVSTEAMEKTAFDDFIRTLEVDFPTSVEMSKAARMIEGMVYDRAGEIIEKPDAKLLKWSDVEYRLFRAIEAERYGVRVRTGFPNIEAFIDLANQVLNRRKSRAGKSLEHHLSAIFEGNGLQFEEQVVTEGNKRPDFIFPSSAAYHDPTFSTDKIIFLAAKTTCKDRWRQILNEADRLRGKPKYLCTLQQGISVQQMMEMQSEKVVLVVPTPYISYYPAETREGIMNIERFVRLVKTVQPTTSPRV